MSLVSKLKPHIEDLKVHKPPMELSPTERRLNQLTALMLNKKMDAKVRDRLMREIVNDSQIEKKLKSMGIKV